MLDRLSLAGSRRALLVALGFAALLPGVAAATPAITPSAPSAIVPTDSPNLLDHPVVDVALLDPAGPDDVERLLIVDAIEPAPGQARLAILQRDRAWSVVSELVVTLADAAEPEQARPWLVRLDAATFALIRSPRDHTDGAYAIVRTDAGPGGDQLDAGPTRRPGGALDDAGAGDVDGDGVADLVLGWSRLPRSVSDCPGSRLTVLRGPAYDTPVRFDHPSGLTLVGGALGAWDDVVGDDLLAYGYRDCETGDDARPIGPSLTAVRLTDGTLLLDRAIVDLPEPRFLGAPIRVDVDGVAPDEVVAMTSEGMAVLDPGDDWLAMPIASRISFPSGAFRVGSDETRLTWTEFDQETWLASAVLRRDEDGLLQLGEVLRGGELGIEPPTSWSAVASVGLVAGQAPPVAWWGATEEPGCPDLLLPSVMLPCGDATFRVGASWVATRPIAVLGDARSRLLVAAGLSTGGFSPLPDTPTPAATQPRGAWRHGPSGVFALAELRAADATYYRDFPDPRVTIERTSLADASTNIPAFTGVRVFTRVQSQPLGRPDPDPDPPLDEVFAFGQDGQPVVDVARVSVPPGVEAGRDGGFVKVDLSTALQPDGRPSQQWVVQAVPINDWGELGSPVAGVVIRDAVGPSLVVDAPFTTPVWPIPATLHGSAEPGAEVVVDGIGPMELDRRGRFEISTTLAPWPQTVRVVATDPSGNVTVREVSVVGGVDYRRFPWGIIAAAVVLGAVMISGLRGARGGPARLEVGGTTRWPDRPGGAWSRRDVLDEGPVAEMEDLPPGTGLR